MLTIGSPRPEKVQASDLEKTIVDGLKQPEYCGGFSEIAKGFWIRREDIDPGKLVDYALKINVGAVIRRLGFLLELFEMEASRELERLRERPHHDLFDPGSYYAGRG